MLTDPPNVSPENVRQFITSGEDLHEKNREREREWKEKNENPSMQFSKKIHHFSRRLINWNEKMPTSVGFVRCFWIPTCIGMPPFLSFHIKSFNCAPKYGQRSYVQCIQDGFGLIKSQHKKLRFQVEQIILFSTECTKMLSPSIRPFVHLFLVNIKRWIKGVQYVRKWHWIVCFEPLNRD